MDEKHYEPSRESENKEYSLDQYVEFEEMFLRASLELARVDHTTLDAAVHKALTGLGRVMRADRAYIFQYRDDGPAMDNTHEWCAAGIEPQMDKLKGINVKEELPWFMKQIGQNQAFSVSDMASLPQEAVKERYHFGTQKIQALFVTPLEAGEAMIGYLGVDDTKSARKWTPQEKKVLRFMGRLLSDTIDRVQSQQKLHQKDEDLARKNAELERSYKETREFMDSITDILWRCRINREGEFVETFISPQADRFLGLPAGTIDHDFETFFSYIHPEDLPMVHQVWKEIIQKALREEPFQDEAEYRMVRSDQTWRWVHTRGITKSLRESEVSLIGRTTDITKLKDVQEELKAKEEQLQLVVTGADLGTWDWNVVTGDVHFNDRWAGMLGYTLDQIDPHYNSWKDLTHPDDYAKAYAVLKKHLGGETGFYSAEVRMRHKEGHWIWILDKGRVTSRDSQGRALRACGTHMDITEMKQAQEALQEKVEEIERSNRLMMGREKRIIEIKREVNALLSELGRDKKYTMVE